MTIRILTVGDEILIGQIIDTNSAWMARQLNLIGARVVGIDSVGDEASEIREGLDRALSTADVVLMTGGLGPTKDDITKKTLAEYFGMDLRFDEPTWDRIQRLFARWGRSTTPAHREQCYMPDGAELLHNKMGTAPGMWFEQGRKVVVSMPGVPYEMKYLMEREVLTRLQKKFPGRPIAHRTILTVGEGESRLAQRLGDFEESLPEGMKLAFLPNLGRVRLRLSGMHDDHAVLDQMLDEQVARLKERIEEFVYGEGELALEEAIGLMLSERGLTVGTAESCTGGYVAHMITSVSGSSAYFEGSIVSYSNALKEQLLGVSQEVLTTHGAVSEQTVKAMVTGGLNALGTDLVVATSGIAGPTGGSEEKPVGTVWMAVGNAERTETFLLRAGKDRIKNIQYASVYALNLLRKFVLAYYVDAHEVKVSS